ncbi:MAG TPA: ATP synthase F1 subunit delta [Terriglobia bacterium]|nr:ATP synthase F1 subunit delta [Terriglobia bacterium]
MSVAANRYAKALLDVLYPANAEIGLDQLVKFSALLESQHQMRQLFENPTVAADRRKAVFGTIADSLAYQSSVRNFLNLLIERNRLDLLSDIVSAYQKLLDEKLGLVRAHVTSATPLDAAQQRELAAKLESVTGKQVRVELSVDPSLIGGVVAQVGSTIYDGSIRQQLQAFKHRLIHD